MDGEPDLRIEGLSLWIHGRQFPDAEEYWDGDWLNVTARYERGQSSVGAGGSILRVSEIVQFRKECEGLYESLEGKAKLDCLEPNLTIELSARIGGHVSTLCRITPEHLSEQHQFSGCIDQSYLPGVISQCKRIEASYPPRGTPDTD